MLKRSWPVLAVALVLSSAAGCSSATDPISVTDKTVTVENRSSRDWTNVVVTVNDHFRGGASRLAAHGRLTAPLSQFQTGYGQRYTIDRAVIKVEVTATDSSGEAVRLSWGRQSR